MRILDVFNKISPHQADITRPYIIAEAGVNHEGSMDIARRLVSEAKEGGADAIKFQSYKASTLASKDSPAYWDTSKEPTDSQFKLFSKHDKFWKTEMIALKEFCDQTEIEFMSTPFDIESAAFLNDLMDVYKISSSDLTNKPFIEYICGFRKPIILSTGASHLHEIQEAVSWVGAYENPIALLHCVLNYPTLDEDANLGMIKGLQKAFPDNLIGYSDHTLPGEMKVLEIATLLGSTIIEKHFTHDKTLEGNDHYHAMDKNDLTIFIKKLDEIDSLMGTSKVVALPGEQIAVKNARRSLVSCGVIPAGHKISRSDLTFKRPAHGISPKYINDVIGKRAKFEILEDSVLKWGMIDE